MNTTIRQIPHTATWNIRHKVMWPNLPVEKIKLPLDEEGTHFGLFDNEKLTTIVSLFFTGKSAQFRKLATEEHEQGKGYASQLLTHIITYAAEQNVEKIWCNARVNKIKFYHKFGMYTTDNTFSKNGVDFVVMEKTLN